MKRTKKVTEIAVVVAMAVVCSFIKVFEMPQGGSISLTMVPLFLIAQRRGVITGCITGSIYGILSALLAGVIYHPASLLLDYILAFAAVGIAGFFNKNLAHIILGTTLGVFGRFIFSFISGAVLFASYAPEGQNPWLYSLIYQSSYLIPELLIALAVLSLLYLKAPRIYRI